MEVSPFRGIRYDQSVAGDVAQTICPPYDVIDAEQQALYYKRSSYNAIRLEFPKPTTVRYQRAAATFQQWLKRGILRPDSVPSFYLHDHHFEYSGRKMTRHGIIARVRLAAWGKGVYPHEETASKAKSDRLQLLRACRASFSPLLSLYQDSQQKVAPILSRVAQEKPLMSTTIPFPGSPAKPETEKRGRSNLPDSNEAHTLWAITDTEIKRELSSLLSSQPLYIADGHHRYETALAYQQERAQAQSAPLDSSVIATLNGRKRKQSVTGKAPFNYVMMELVDFSDPGLVILPLHRLVRGIAPSILLSFANRLREFFSVESIPSTPDRLRLTPDSCLGILGMEGGSLVLLKRRPDVSLEAMMPHNRSQAYREFAVSILNHVILDVVLGGAEGLDISYTADLEEAHRQILEGKYQLAFLLHPAKPEIVKRIGDAQDRLPTKSTYFYPKAPAGLVINSLD